MSLGYWEINQVMTQSGECVVEKGMRIKHFAWLQFHRVSQKQLHHGSFMTGINKRKANEDIIILEITQLDNSCPNLTWTRIAKTWVLKWIELVLGLMPTNLLSQWSNSLTKKSNCVCGHKTINILKIALSWMMVLLDMSLSQVKLQS